MAGPALPSLPRSRLRSMAVVLRAVFAFRSRRSTESARARCRRRASHTWRIATYSFAGLKLFSVLAGRVVSGAAVFNPSDFGGNDLARVGDLVVDFVLDPALWRDLNG